VGGIRNILARLDSDIFADISTQGTLTFGSTQDVRKEVQRQIGILAQGGGYICSPDQTVLDNVPLENVLELYNTAAVMKL
jgi:hypothetical protein